MPEDRTGLSAANSKSGQLQRALLDLLHEHKANGDLPTANRFGLYVLRQRGGPLFGHYSRRDGRSQDQNLSDASKHLRDVGLVPWDWIVDETRHVTTWQYAATVIDYVRDAIEAARIDCWGGQQPPLLLCESRTFGGVLERTVAPEYLCPVAATNGQVGGFLHTNIAPLLRGNEAPVLYIGDHDKHGYKIEDNTRRVLVHEAGDREWTRVALTADQVAAHGLPIVQKLNRQTKPPEWYDAVEVEALGQGIVLGLVRDALDALLPEPLHIVTARLQAQQGTAMRYLARFVDHELGT